jgi:hypothetical protein
MKKLLHFTLLFFAFTMQSQNRIESVLFEAYVSGTWQVSGGYNYEYDANNNLTNETYYSLFNNAWTTLDKLTYSYNTNNRVITEIYSIWNNNQFDNNNKTIYTYNASNKPTTILNQDWNGSSWVNDSKTDISYSGTFFVDAITKEWDGTQYVNDYKSTPTYSGNNAAQWLNEQWDGFQWIIDGRTSLTYNANNKITNYKNQDWTGSGWDDEENLAYTYALNFNRLTQINSYFGELNGKYVYNYDTNALMTNFGNPFTDKTGIDYVFEDFPYTNKILTEVYSNYDTTTSTYSLSSRTTYNYISALPLAREDFKLNKISLYPNPVTSTFELSGLTTFAKISIYNLLGTKVFEGSVTANDKVNIENLAGGLYLLNFENGEAIKFVKE